MSIHTEDPTTFRKEAQECRRQAAQAIAPLDKAFWLELAQSWERMADIASEPYQG